MAAKARPSSSRPRRNDSLLLDLRERSIRMEEQNRFIIAEQARAATSRREIYTRLTELTVELAGVTSSVTRIVPLVDAAEVRRQQAAGLWKLTALGANHMGKLAIAGGVAAVLWLTEALHGWLPEWVSRVFK